MGLADQVSSDVFLGDGVYSLWARDGKEQAGDGVPGKNSYGVSPYLMAPANDTTWFGVFYNLAAAQDWWVKKNATSSSVSLKTYAAGGTGDIYIMLGNNPNEVVKKYHEIIGKPVLTPQWALGWHAGKQGYKNCSIDLLYSITTYQDYGIPFDTQWTDIETMHNYMDFTYDP